MKGPVVAEGRWFSWELDHSSEGVGPVGQGSDLRMAAHRVRARISMGFGCTETPPDPLPSLVRPVSVGAQKGASTLLGLAGSGVGPARLTPANGKFSEAGAMWPWVDCQGGVGRSWVRPPGERCERPLQRGGLVASDGTVALFLSGPHLSALMAERDVQAQVRVGPAQGPTALGQTEVRRFCSSRELSA
jgi:hypothetical protein